jgi:hypothetical protein
MHSQDWRWSDLIEEILYLAGAIVIIAGIKAMLKPRKKVEQFEDILDKPEYKVKGRFET